MSYPNPCSYCKEIHGVRSCLLPYQIVQWIRINPVILRSQIKLSKVHGDYGEHSLQIAKRMASIFETQGEFTYDTNLRAEGEYLTNSQPSTSYSYYPTGENQGSIKAKSVSETPDITTASSDVVLVKELEIQRPQTEEVFPVIDLKSKKSFDNRPITPNVCEQPTDKDKENTHQPAIKSESKDNGEQKPPSNCPRDEDILSIAKDVCGSMLVIKASSNAKGNQVTVSEFFEVIISEISKVRRFGSNYKTVTQKVISHPTGLAKYLFSYHHADSFYQWESDVECDSHRLCLLNFESLKLRSESDDPINGVLKAYVSSVFHTLKSYPDKLQRVKQLVDLESRVLSTNNLLNWYSQFLKQEKGLAENVKSRSTKEVTEIKNLQLQATQPGKTVKHGHECPPIPEIDKIVIEFNLKDVVKTLVDKKKPNIKGFGSGEELQIKLTNLLKEIICHRKQWEKLNETISISSFSRFLSLSGYEVNKSELVPIISITCDIVKELAVVKEKVKS